MKKKSKRLLSAFLALSLCLGLMSPAALATEPEEDNVPGLTTETVTPSPEVTAPEQDEIVTPEDENIADSEVNETTTEEEEIVVPQDDKAIEPEEKAGEPLQLTFSNPEGLGAGESGQVYIEGFTKGLDGIGVDSFTYSISGNATDKVDFDSKTGVVTVKEGQTIQAGDKVTVSASVTYYPANQIQWIDDMETEKSLTNDPAGNGIYSLNHSETSSRTGHRAGTPAEVVKNGVWKDGINQTGKLVYWYYDPATTEEKTRTYTDQVKFGVMINAYSTLFLGVAVPSITGDLGPDGQKFTAADQRDPYRETYTYRADSRWYRTNIERAEGWHKFEINVAGDGTTMSIGGVPVCLNGSDEPIKNTNVTSITKAIIATNWGDKAEMKTYVDDKHFIDDIYLLKPNATTATCNPTVDINLNAEVTPIEPTLTFGADNSESLAKGETGRVYLDNMGDCAIKSVEYTTNNTNVTVSADGTLEVKAGYAPAANEKVTVTAKVTYYNTPSDVIFADSFEGEKTFTVADAVAYKHSDVNALFGRKAATAGGSTKGYPECALPKGTTDVTLTAWYYDPNGRESQVKFGLSPNGGNNAMGVVYDGNIAPLVNDLTYDNYAARIPTGTYNNYSWGTTDAPRSEGWHKFEWVINSTTGMTIKVDGKVVSTNTAVGDGTGSNVATNHELVKAENIAAVKELTKLTIQAGWNNNATNLGAIMDKHFIDGVTVTKNTATTAEKTLTSVAIPVLDTQYTHSPLNPTVDSTYPSDLTVMVKPGLEELVSVALDNTPLDDAKWNAVLDNGPQNASYYPAEMKGWKLTVDGAVLKTLNLTDGAHKLVLTMSSGSTYEIPFTAAANTYVARDYYLSNSGDDSKDGHTEATAWATFEKLSTATFGPGDKIHLDATSFWNGVQFRPKGSGAPGAPIVMTKYNDGGDPSKRPILNGDGTVADKTDYNYLAFDSWRRFYPSGTIELFNVEYWEVKGIEITNYRDTYGNKVTGQTVGGKPGVTLTEDTGRNGIAVIHDFTTTVGMTELPGTAGSSPYWSGDETRNREMEQAFYKAGKLQHIVIENNYIHDVTGYHPGSGATGAGGKMSGGINVYGPFDDLKLDNNIIMYCDVEGIRNDVLAWRGDTRTQFPAYMEGVSISNNFIVGVPGDGVVISSADEPRLANNYLTDAGYSYMVDKAGSTTTAKPMGNRDNPVIINNSTNFAGLWFIGTKNAVAEYNESVNNVWTCNDGEAFDADMFTWGTMFQYNYTYRNNGGLCLFMTGNQMDDGTIVRYNVSIEDGEGVGTPDDGRKAIFHYNKEPDAIYNNLFVLGNGVRGMFGGDSNTAYFYNNMVIKPDGQIGNFSLNTKSNSNATATAMTGGALKNNLFYPAAILNNVTGTITKADNVTPDNLDGIFYDLTAFMAAQPVHALNGRSALTGTPVNMTGGTGVGVAMSDAAGRKVTAPDGTGFDYTQFEGIKTVEGSPTIGAGITVDHGHPGYEPYPGNEEVYPLKTDFFKNDITKIEGNPDIGPYQWSADASHFVKLTYEGNGATVAVEAAKSGATHTLPAPRKDNYIFAGWYTEAGLTNKVASPYTVPAAGVTLYAKWVERPADTYDVTFDSQGGSPVDSLIAVAKDSNINAPAAPTKEHYVFKGWFKESACTNKWDFATDTVTANTTLFAKWEGETFTVTFDKNGGGTEANPTTKTVIYPATTVDALPTAPDKAGFTFVGWTTTRDGSDFFSTGTAVTANVTVYAKWVQNAADTFNVLFDALGGSTVNPILGVAKGNTITAPTEPTKAHYVFKGWFKENACTNKWDFATDTITANTTLYAKWEGETFTVTFDKNEGDTEADPAAMTVTYPATTVDALPTAPTKAEHTFMGWTTTQNGSTFFDTATAVTANITVYAKWASNDDLAIAAAKTLVEGATYTIAQANAITEATVRARLTAMVEALNLGGVSALVNKVSYTYAVSGTESNPAGTNGSYVFTVTLSKGTGTNVTTEQLTMTITATAYVAPSPAPSPSTPKPKPEEKPAENVTATEGGKVDSKLNANGSTTYTFKPEKEKDVLYVRVNGLLVKADSYIAAKGETPSIVVVFGESGTDHTKNYADTAELPEYMTDAVNYVVGSGLFQGTGEGFMPMGNMNRAMFATVLARLYGADTTKLTSDFADVAQGSWYEGGVAWISDMGITSGVGGGNFAPEADMTRQELVTLVYRFAQKVGADVSATGDLTTFPDGGSVDAWSTDAMSWAVGLGMINGKSGALAPNDTITRVEAAIILQRMADLLTKA